MSMSAGAEQSFPLFGFEFRTVLDLIIETLANRVLWSRDLLLSHRLDVAFYLTPTPAVVSRRFHSRDNGKVGLNVELLRQPAAVAAAAGSWDHFSAPLEVAATEERLLKDSVDSLATMNSC